MSLFRKRAEPHALTLAMTGVRMGDRLLQLGCTDAGLLVALSRTVGLSGRACVAVPTDQQAADAERAAEQAGLLVEVKRAAVTALPFEDGSFGLIVADCRSPRGLTVNGGRAPAGGLEDPACFRDAHRVLEPRGRLVVLMGQSRRFGPLAWFADRAPRPSELGDAGLAALRGSGFNAVRVLAERNGLVFAEGVKRPA